MRHFQILQEALHIRQAARDLIHDSGCPTLVSLGPLLPAMSGQENADLTRMVFCSPQRPHIMQLWSSVQQHTNILSGAL